MAIKKKTGRRKGGTTVNFSGVESGGRRCPDGEYQAEIFEAELEESKAGNPMIVAKWKITAGKYKGTTIYDQISLVPQALWKLKTLLEVLGVDPQEDDVEASEYVSEILEKEATIIVKNETYEGEDRPKVVGYGAGDDDSEESDDAGDDDDEADEKPAKKGAKGKTAAKDDDDDEDDEEEDDEEDDAEDDEEDDEEEDPPARNPKGKASSKSKVKEGSRVKFDDGDGNIIKGTVTSLDKGKATVEDKNGDEYEIDAEDVTVL